MNFYQTPPTPGYAPSTGQTTVTTTTTTAATIENYGRADSEAISLTGLEEFDSSSQKLHQTAV